MLPSTLLTTLLATMATASAVPSTNPAPIALIPRDTNIANVQAAAQTALDAKIAAGCNFLKCVIALAPASAVCAAAAAEAGVNVIADIACFAAALNLGANPPAACRGC
ncbi:hypothetical protein P280DRAFT_515367 [Massarina eburnea CBS 473.64]|uniref:Fungal calcium binding protein domain-containing protein n=1 Tax=Massarina eburnea CBS 473.64 TaxID=1395130 RepID=A0A6A6S916_9PLEO|nr:hypothetical protein P280DRAFT_515367 [Massarina eburnea CBS 473.64]